MSWQNCRGAFVWIEDTAAAHVKKRIPEDQGLLMVLPDGMTVIEGFCSRYRIHEQAPGVEAAAMGYLWRFLIDADGQDLSIVVCQHPGWLGLQAIGVKHAGRGAHRPEGRPPTLRVDR